MEAFYRTHAYLVEHTNAPVRRDLMDEIDWNDRLIGIKGTRGVGKTTFLLQYAKEKFGTDRSCLFINMNNFTSPVTAWWTSLTNSSAAAERYC